MGRIKYKKSHSFWGLMTLLFTISCQQHPKTLFEDVSPASGIDFSNDLTETEAQNVLNFEYMYNGGGIAVGDVNGDGLIDIFFTGNQVPDKLYLNKGNLKFEDITEKSGVAGRPGWKTGVCMADVNGDGLLDIYVCYSGKNNSKEDRRNELFINKGVQNGVPVFNEEAADYGLDAPGTNSTQAVFFDYDRDGDLDMFLLDHATSFYAPFVNTNKLRNKRHPYFSNYLFRNDKGHFTDVSEQAGIKGGGNNFGLGVTVSDINNDGWPDIYYTNDYEEQDFLLLNNHEGTFKDVTKRAIRHISKYGMGCDVADYNNDGWNDILVMDMLPEDNKRQKLLRGPDEYDKYMLLVDSGYFHQNMRNTLQLNRGCGADNVPVFSEIGQLAGMSNTDWSWAPLLADFDNDGQKDLFVSNGYWRDYTNMDFLSFDVQEYKNANPGTSLGIDLVRKMPQTKLNNYIFKNTGNLTFENKTTAWGFDKQSISNGAVYADLDNDGDLDIVINNIGEKASVYRNNSDQNAGGHFLRIKLKGADANSNAIGAKLTIETKDGQKQMLEQYPVRGYQSGVDPVLHFGLDSNTFIKRLVVQWPRGTQTALNNIKADMVIELDETKMPYDTTAANLFAADTAHLFSDYTAQSGINFTQKENEFVDFKSEFLLPWELSKQGPRLAKADVNGDGLEDLFIGAPMGQAAALYLQTPDERFVLASSQPWKADRLCEDIQAAFFDADGDGDLDLYVVSGDNEPHTDTVQTMDRLYLNNGRGVFTKLTGALPAIAASKSCVAVADYNKDGKPDLFVGGRAIPSRYGQIPKSYLLCNKTQNGQCRFSNTIQTDAPGLESAGMVTDAVWTDLNKDGWADLIVVGEWMPVRIFINNKGKLHEATHQYGLATSGGLWTKIIPGDFDNDGDTDFILGNLAPNTQFSASVKEPMTLYAGDFLNTGVSSCILNYYIQGVSYPYPSRDELTEVMPGLKKKFLKYADYATATMKDIFTDEQLKGVQLSAVQTLKNTYLENGGQGKLLIRELPVMAQFSPLFAAATVTHAGSSQQQLLAVGNFYPFRVQLGREDAGIGVILQFDSKTITAKNTGSLKLDGDIRDMVVVQTKNKNSLYIIAKNNDKVQVLKSSR